MAHHKKNPPMGLIMVSLALVMLVAAVFGVVSGVLFIARSAAHMAAGVIP